MTSQTGNNPISRSNDARPRRAFTLIELILVMAVLTIAVALVTPILSRFFGGRSVDSEVSRFVALTRYGQSRAVSEGVPMMLWIDVRNGSYGLKQETGYTDNDPKA
ncbi:MAG TPA: prepilin-type N-terminal cleavage/methylation domain-containing protein, partial [Verrucomicrobiae bacterium]|nr:prepilin-type N-terminal cleavage/methylation domain-containing protein [Verrucomicrobiae bacterium]